MHRRTFDRSLEIALPGTSVRSMQSFFPQLVEDRSRPCPQSGSHTKGCRRALLRFSDGSRERGLRSSPSGHATTGTAPGVPLLQPKWRQRDSLVCGTDPSPFRRQKLSVHWRVFDYRSRVTIARLGAPSAVWRCGCGDSREPPLNSLGRLRARPACTLRCVRRLETLSSPAGPRPSET